MLIQTFLLLNFLSLLLNNQLVLKCNNEKELDKKYEVFTKYVKFKKL